MHWEAIAILGAGSLVVGLVLYLPMRWVFLRNKEPGRSPTVRSKGVIAVAPLLLVMLALFWFKEAGSSLAGYMFTGLMVGVCAFASWKLAKTGKGKNE